MKLHNKREITNFRDPSFIECVDCEALGLETPIIIAIVAGMIHRQIFEYISPPLDNDRELRTSRQNCTCRHASQLGMIIISVGY